MNTERNLYCERLGLSIPRLDDVVGRKGVKLFHLMVVALLELGRPMGLGDLAGRLSGAGIVAGSGDLARSLKKAWHGMERVYRDADGRFGLNLSSAALEAILRTAGLRAPRFGAPAPTPLPAQPGDEMPLSKDELDAAFRDRFISAFSALRQAAAVLDALGHPATVEGVDAFLARLTRHREALTVDRVRYWRSALVVMDEEGRLTLNRASPDLGTMRRAVRNLAGPVLVHRVREASALRRAVLRAVPESENPRALALLDVLAAARFPKVLVRGARPPERFPGQETGGRAFREVCEVIAQAIGGRIVVFDNSAHNPQMEEAEEFNDFLRGVWRSARRR